MTPVTSLVIMQPDTPNQVVEAPEINVLAVRPGIWTVMDQYGTIHCAGMQPNMEAQVIASDSNNLPNVSGDL